MGMDFNTQERLEEVEVFRLDDLVQPEVPIPVERREPGRDTWFSLLRYWISELRWRMKYWDSNRG